jgi:hypothetical protein
MSQKTGTSMNTTVLNTRKIKMNSVACNCHRCVNFNRNKNCDLGKEPKNGKCRFYGDNTASGYTLTKEEKKAIKAHNKRVDELRKMKTAAKFAKKKSETL